MITFKIDKKEKSASISMVVNDGNDYDAISVSEGSDKDLVADVFKHLSAAYGAFGHSIDIGNTTAIDVHSALCLSPFEFEVTEGRNLVETYTPDIPQGALT